MAESLRDRYDANSGCSPISRRRSRRSRRRWTRRRPRLPPRPRYLEDIGGGLLARYRRTPGTGGSRGGDRGPPRIDRGDSGQFPFPGGPPRQPRLRYDGAPPSHERAGRPRGSRRCDARRVPLGSDRRAGGRALVTAQDMGRLGERAGSLGRGRRGVRARPRRHRAPVRGPAPARRQADVARRRAGVGRRGRVRPCADRRPAAAILALERGRARVLTEAIQRDRADLADVEALDPDAYAAYEQAAGKLRALESQERAGGTGRPEAASTTSRGVLQDEARQVRADLQAAIGRLQQLPGHARFGRLPTVEEVAGVAEPGCPVVALVTTTAGSVALLVVAARPTRPPRPSRRSGPRS